ncbi:GlxA family transcriptional regulator [Nocardia sp. BMG111209]|uniref:GlxA family transcriptional regulator n=1 Tax=Nocardia sp. BMG111209 TaxID=1160137 RepID=UPI000379A921|nr:GlxA family transcriptional regulator [Nocardia sp. BMG111209]
MPGPRTVVFVVFDGMQMIELAGPMDVFVAANTMADTPRYRLVTASPTGGNVTADGGLRIAVDTSVRAAAASGEIDTMIVVGGAGVFAGAVSAEVVRDLPALARGSGRVASVCAGAWLLAAAGLLDGYRATTHWTGTELFANRYPRVTVEPDRIYVHDRDRWTSAGVSAGIDLALALVEADHGGELAQLIARLFVVFARRPGGQTQFSAQLRTQPARTPAIRAVQQWLPEHLGEDLSVAVLARRAGLSERHFARAFRAETGCTPAAFVENLRVEAARRLLESTELTVGAVARAVGYRHGETLHRVFARRLATTPERYRQHFAVASA